MRFVVNNNAEISNLVLLTRKFATEEFRAELHFQNPKTGEKEIVAVEKLDLVNILENRFILQGVQAEKPKCPYHEIKSFRLVIYSGKEPVMTIDLKEIISFQVFRGGYQINANNSKLLREQ